MDKEVLKRQLMERCQAALDKAWRAVDESPDGHWIAACMKLNLSGMLDSVLRPCYTVGPKWSISVYLGIARKQRETP